MKKFTKLFLSCTAVAALAAAMGTAAMAATVSGNVAGSFDENAGTLTLTTELSDTATILVLDSGVDLSAVTDDDILYIDQTSTGSFGTMGLLGGTDLADGKYPIYVGYYDDSNEFAILEGTLTIGNVTTEVISGDVNESGNLDARDATAVLRKISSLSTMTYTAGNKYNNAAGDGTVVLGDVNESGALDINDATAILRKISSLSTMTYTAGDTITIGSQITETE